MGGSLQAVYQLELLERIRLQCVNLDISPRTVSDQRTL